MDDLSQQINQILSDPQSMQQIQGIMNSLGMNGAPSASGLDPSALAGALNALGGLSGGGQPQASTPLGGVGNADGGSPFGAVTPEMLQMVTRLAPLLNQVNREDDSTRLLRALRPLLSEARQKKVDEAMKILQMMRLLPLLKESGVFSGLLSGLL